MNTREISQSAHDNFETANDYYVELTHSSGQILTLTVGAMDIQDVLNTLSERNYKNPTKIEKK